MTFLYRILHFCFYIFRDCDRDHDHDLSCDSSCDGVHDHGDVDRDDHGGDDSFHDDPLNFFVLSNLKFP